jgi:hypothetical protein
VATRGDIGAYQSEATSVEPKELIRFSHVESNRRLGVAAFARNRIAVFDIDVATSAAGPPVALTGGVELSSPVLNSPYGPGFIDDETLIVANRTGDVAIFKLPTGEPRARSYEVLPDPDLVGRRDEPLEIASRD